MHNGRLGNDFTESKHITRIQRGTSLETSLMFAFALTDDHQPISILSTMDMYDDSRVASVAWPWLY